MRWVERTFLRLAVLGAAALYAHGASALTVTYEWVPGTNSPTANGGVGTLVIDSAAITDPNDFTGIAAGALVSFDYEWQHGQTFSSVDPGYTVAVSSPGWSAAGGFLTTNFTIAKPLYGLNGVPYNSVFPDFGTSSNNVNQIGTMAAEVDAGNWQFKSVSSVPLPAAGWLLLSGLGGLVRLRRRAQPTVG